MREQGEDLFRYKGVLAVKGMDAKFVFQGVHMLFGGEFSEEIGLWKEGEERECRFVFIGRDLDPDALQQGLMACQAEDLRFKVGDTVYANIGEFTKGRILKCWDEGNRTESRSKTTRRPTFGCPLTTTITSARAFEVRPAPQEACP